MDLGSECGTPHVRVGSIMSGVTGYSLSRSGFTSGTRQGPQLEGGIGYVWRTGKSPRNDCEMLFPRKVEVAWAKAHASPFYKSASARVAWTPRSGRNGPGGPFYFLARTHSWNALARRVSEGSSRNSRFRLPSLTLRVGRESSRGLKPTLRGDFSSRVASRGRFAGDLSVSRSSFADSSGSLPRTHSRCC